MISETELHRDGYVVEQGVKQIGADGQPFAGSGTARVYVDNEERALEIVAQAPSTIVRTHRRIPLSEMPEEARENLLRARSAR